LPAVRGNAAELEDLSTIEECRDAIFADRLFTSGGQIGQRMNLYSLESWSKSLGGRCRFIHPLDELPQTAVLEGDDRVLLTRLRHEIVLARTAIEASRISITESRSLISSLESAGGQ